MNSEPNTVEGARACHLLPLSPHFSHSNPSGLLLGLHLVPCQYSSISASKLFHRYFGMPSPTLPQWVPFSVRPAHSPVAAPTLPTTPCALDFHAHPALLHLPWPRQLSLGHCYHCLPLLKTSFPGQGSVSAPPSLVPWMVPSCMLI